MLFIMKIANKLILHMHNSYKRKVVLGSKKEHTDIKSLIYRHALTNK